MIFRRRQEELDAAYDDGLQAGLQMGYIAAETRIKNIIENLDGAEWVIDEIDAADEALLEDDE